MNLGYGVCGEEGHYKVPKYCNGHIAQAGLALPEYAARIVLAAGSTSRLLSPPKSNQRDSCQCLPSLMIGPSAPGAKAPSQDARVTIGFKPGRPSASSKRASFPTSLLPR